MTFFDTKQFYLLIFFALKLCPESLSTLHSDWLTISPIFLAKSTCKSKSNFVINRCANKSYTLSLVAINVFFHQSIIYVWIIWSQWHLHINFKFQTKHMLRTFSFHFISYIGELWTYFHCYHNANNVNHGQMLLYLTQVS